MRIAVSWVALVAILLTLLASGPAAAGEAGLSEYLPGLADLLAGVVPPPGLHYRSYKSYHSARAETVVEGRSLRQDVRARFSCALIALTQITERQVFGGSYGYGLLVPFASLDITARVREDATGVGDIMVIPLLVGWHRGDEHWSASTVVYAPTGSYRPEGLASLGRNQWALEQDFGYTWLDPETGGELSCLLGYTVPFSNADTDYRSGHELHLDFALAQHYPNGTVLGLVGYWFQQTTPDKGEGALLGPFPGMTSGLGPIVSWNGSWKGKPINFVTKYYWDLETRNRLKGESLWFNFSLSL